MSGLPDFISQFAHFDPQLPPPYRFDNVSARIFALKANKDQLQNLCDKRINDVAAAAGKTFVVKPMTEGILLEILEYKKMYSEYDGAQNSGYSSQNELFFAIPVVLYKDAAAAQADNPQSIGLFVPFIFVDNDWSLISAREICGLQKLFGHFTLPDDPDKLSDIDIKAHLIASYGPNSRAEYKSIVTIESDDETEPTQGDKTLWPFGPIEQLYVQDAAFAVSDPVLRLLREAVLNAKVSSFSLRQFREGMTPEKASFRSLIRTRMKLAEFDSATIVGNPTISFPGVGTNPYKGYQSVNLVQELGLEHNNQTGTVTPAYSFLFKGSYTFDVRDTLITQCGENVWSTDPGMSCSDIIGIGARDAAKLMKKQARVAKSLMHRMCECDHEGIASDLEKGCRNTLKYYKSVCRLTKASIRHMLPD